MAKKDKADPPMTMQEIADELGCKVRTVQKWRQKLELGTPFHRTYLLTKRDAKEIAKHIRDGVGNPEFGDKWTGATAKRKRTSSN